MGNRNRREYVRSWAAWPPEPGELWEAVDGWSSNERWEAAISPGDKILILSHEDSLGKYEQFMVLCPAGVRRITTTRMDIKPVRDR